MTFYIVLDKQTGLDALSAEAARGDRPSHAMALLRDQLDAVVHARPPDAVARPDDRLPLALVNPSTQHFENLNSGIACRFEKRWMCDPVLQ